MIPKLLASMLAAVLLAGVCLAYSKQPVNDDAISDQVMIKLTADAVVKGGALKCDVKDGVVTLTGTVGEQRQKERAGKLAGKVKGVKKVINNITISKTGR
jgi:hyperosmotically inducible periplasmic protein